MGPGQPHQAGFRKPNQANLLETKLMESDGNQAEPREGSVSRAKPQWRRLRAEPSGQYGGVMP